MKGKTGLPRVRVMRPSKLSAAGFHDDAAFITRYIAAGFPVHAAVHRVRCTRVNAKRYVRPHAHAKPEINIILGDRGALKYSLQLGDERRVVRSPAAVFVPAHVQHAANVISGKGYFVCIILEDTYRAYKGRRNEDHQDRRRGDRVHRRA